MLVKIGNKIYTADKEPIMIIRQDGDEENMHCLKDNSYRFCFFPLNSCIKDIEEFMKVDGDDLHGA